MEVQEPFPSVLDVPVSTGRLLGEDMKEDNGIPQEIVERFTSATHKIRSLAEAFPTGSIHNGLFVGLANCVDSEYRSLSSARNESSPEGSVASSSEPCPSPEASERYVVDLTTDPPLEISKAAAYWCELDYFLAHTAHGAHPPCACPPQQGHNDQQLYPSAA